MHSIWNFLYDSESDNKCKERVQALIDNNGADITAGNNHAVRWAAQMGKIETVRLLLDYGADITAEDNDAVKCAACNGHIEIVRLLIEHGATLKE